MAERLFGFFPRGAASDPEIFMTGVVQLLARYPLSAVESVLSPISGIPAKHKFLPSISEIREMLEAQCPPPLPPEHHPMPRIEGPPRVRLTREELEQKYGPGWGLKYAQEKAKSSWGMDPKSLMALGGLTPEQWDALPDAKEAPHFKRAIP